MTTETRTLQLEGTGDSAFDTVLGGGIPSRSLTVIAGEPGSGKTVFALQMLFHAARQGKKCLYFTTLSEPAMKLIKYMQLFNFFDLGLQEKNISFVDLGTALRDGADRVVETIIARVEAFMPSIVAIDSFRAIEDVRMAGRRPMIFDLAVQLGSWGTTALLIGEYAREEYSTFAEFAIADGIIRIGSEDQDLTAIREVEVLKLRGANFVSGRHFCEISANGFAVYPRVRAPEQGPDEAAETGDRAPTGIEGLDTMLTGGLLRTSSTVVQGATGVGKTILALHFLLEGARRNERGVLFTLEETPEQLRAIATGLGFDLVQREREGLVTICYTSPVELSTDRFLFQARTQVERLSAKRAVFDSLTSMALSVPSERRFKALVYSLAKHLRHAGTTVVMTMEAEQIVGVSKLTGFGVSFLADVLIQLRYLELDGKLERAISVIKARGTKHVTELHGLTVGEGGLRVTPGRFDNLRGLFTGVPIREK